MNMKTKHLDGTGKGEFIYDFQQDILMFKIQDRNYKLSVELQNFVADIDEEGFVTGVRIFDASKVFGVDKYSLKNITSMEFRSDVENNVITITCTFTSKVRNKPVPKQFTQQLTQAAPMHLADSSIGPIAV